MRIILLLVAGLFLPVLAPFVPHEAKAQAIILPCVPSGASCIPVSAANPLPVTSAGGGFPPAGCVTANGVIFNNATPCDSGFVYPGGGGNLALTGGVTAGTSSSLGFSAQGFLAGTGSGILTLYDNTFTSFNRLQLGGTTSSFPSLKRNAAALESRLADDSASANFIAASISATLAAATGTNVVCNTPGTNTALTVQVSATGCAASSARFKEGIASLDKERALADVLAFEPVSYLYKPETNMGRDLHVGFTAEQIGSVDPQWITYEDDGVTPHAVKYQEMIPLLTAAIQQLKVDNDNLRAAIEALRKK